MIKNDGYLFSVIIEVKDYFNGVECYICRAGFAVMAYSKILEKIGVLCNDDGKEFVGKK